jgi:hypothetical protein
MMTEAEERIQPAVVTLPVMTHSKFSIFTPSLDYIGRAARNTFDPRDLHQCQDIDIDTLNKELDLLCQNMTYRLVCHIKQKVPKEKRNPVCTRPRMHLRTTVL